MIALLAIILFLGSQAYLGGDAVGGGSRFPNGLSADGTLPSVGEVRGTTLTVTSTADVTSTSTIGSTDFVVQTDLNRVGIGTSSPATHFQVSNAPVGDGTNATTTVTGGAATSTSRFQMEVRQDDGGVSCAYVNSAGTAWVVEDNACN